MQMSLGELGESALCVALQGRLDTAGVAKIEAGFAAAVAEGQRDAAVDLSAVTFLSSMGVRMIISNARAQRAKGHLFVLFGSQPVVQSTLDMVALDQIIPVVADREAALAKLVR